ncbi:MAG: hypothetical protein KKA07_05685, partial [Bacteroidetes bacterium]|nr:hypothetical protein [Bacteroidota bacterium]
MNWPMHKLRSSLSQEEKFAFRLHLGYAIPDGIILGILALNEFVFIRSLKGSSYQLGLLFQFSMVVFVALIFFYSWLNGIPDKRRLLRKTALITRLPLALLAFFPAQMTGTSADGLWHIAFLAIFFVYYAGTPVIYPSINLFLKSAYSHSNFGQLFSVASSLNKLIMLVVTFAYGLLLDIDASAYRFVFPFVAALGVISVFFLSKIPISTAIAEKHASIAASVKHSMQSMLKVIRTNKPYLHFEIGFMMYGLAFMGSITLVPLFFDQVLHLNYSSVAF